MTPTLRTSHVLAHLAPTSVSQGQFVVAAGYAIPGPMRPRPRLALPARH